MNILVTGANGQLGQCIKAISDDFSQHRFFFTSKEELNIAEVDSLEVYINMNNISVIINCAAYTDVNKAEDDRQLCDFINDTAIASLARASKETNTRLIHISTDYVFNGMANKPYQFNSKCMPLNVYGASKREGELNILSENCDSLIIRTSWLYSEYGNNFFTMFLKNNILEGEFVNDQYGSPTYAIDLASFILSSCLEPFSSNGVYHFTNNGIASWYDFAVMIQTLLHKDVSKIKPITVSDYDKKNSKTVVRPSFSKLDTKKTEEDFNYPIRHWFTALTECVNKILMTKTNE